MAAFKQIRQVQMVTIVIRILCVEFLLVAAVRIPFKKKHSKQKPGDPDSHPNEWQ